jgi:hypothetical protein
VCQTSTPQSATPATQPATAPTPPSATPVGPQSSSKSAAPAAPAKTTNATPQKPAKPKLTARQKQAVDILLSVQGELGRYSPEMQTYLLQEIARDYKQLDRAKQAELLKEAFQAAANMPEGQYRTDQQQRIVKALNEADPAALVSMQYSADPKVREVVLQLLVKQDIDHHRLGAAAKRLSQWDSSLAFPYEYAKEVVSGLGAQQTGERQSVFSSAVAAYRVGEIKVSPEDQMSDLILGVYDLLPPAMVVDAIDLVLDKVAKAEQSQQEHISVTVGGKKGQASFSSMYDFELFELLPVLEKLDPAKADALRRDHATVAALSKKYPDGKSSLSPNGQDTGMMFSTSAGADPPPPPDPDLTQQRQSADAIVESATKNVDAAIANAQTLSNTTQSDYGVRTQRCRVLEKIAENAMHAKNYSDANAALKALVTATQDLPALAQAHYLVRAAAISAQMNDPGAAKQYLNKAMKAADEQYHKDAFGDPPNDAPKAIWPSTASWRGTLVVAEHVDSGFAAEQAASLPDPEIEAVVNVARAGVMLDQEPGLMEMAVWRNGDPMLEMMFDIPWWSMPKAENGN